MHLPVLLTRYRNLVQSLVDSGATLNFIHEALVERLRLQTQLSSPVQVTVANGDILTHANRTVTLKFTIAGIPQEETFLVAPIGIHSIILGMPWLEKMNPQIDWPTKVVKFNDLTPNRFPVTPAIPVEKVAASNQSTKSPPPKSPKRRRKRSPDSKASAFQQLLPKKLREPPKVRRTTKIGPHDQVYVLMIDEIIPLHEFCALAEEQKPVPVIPEEYRDLAHAFSKEKAHELPPHRGHLDHAIDLEPGTKPTFGPIYNLSEAELAVLKEYIRDYLEKGFIQPSQSPFGHPVLFTKKPDGSLRLCVDYRALNRNTIKNRYPLPLISELLDRVKGAKFFTKLDLRDAFHRIRIKAGHEYKTAFRTRYGHYEYNVLPFGLTNGPGTFQSYTNNAVREFLDVFCVVYLDDILIYSNTLEEHVQHVRKILEKLIENGLYVKLEKSQFHVQEINFLGYVITPEGISMEPSRIATIVEWPVPKSMHDVQVFLGFTNFYRRFVEAYSRVTLPITKLLKKDTPFEWTSEAQSAFDRLKSLFTSAPILRHFDPDLPVHLHTDASGFAISGIISQVHNGQLHPVAFWSQKSNPAECNYDIHDRELLAIVSCMKHWRHYLEGAKHPIRVFSDHKNLETFMSTKILNRRQARWAEFLSAYDFVLVHISGSKNPADGPSRRPDYAENVDVPMGTLIPQSALRLLPGNLSNLELATPQFLEYPLGVHLQYLLSLQPIHDPVPKPSIRQRIVEALAKDSEAQSHFPNSPVSPEFPNPWTWQDGLLLHKSLVYIPQDDDIRVEIVRQHHDVPLAGHPGVEKTLELLSRNYYFPGMATYVKNYVTTCDPCSRGKTPRHQKHGELAPIPVPSSPWRGISCDFIVDLPMSKGFDSLLVFVDRLTKMAHYVPCTKTATAPDFARLFIDNVIRLHGIPDSIVSDRGAIFTSHFWKSLSTMLKLKQKLSTAFHPQTDGQTERQNQTIEQYLRMYCNYQQDDWVNYLSIAEFAYNNVTQSSTHVSPFFANYGFHPQLSLNLRPENPNEQAPAATELAEKLKFLHEDLVEKVKFAQNHQAKYYDAKHKRVEFSVGDKVWLSSTNIRTQRPSKKLDWKKLGPYRVLERIGTQSYRLQLPTSMKIHPVFHVSLLEPHKSNSIPGRVQPPPPPVIIDDQEEWEVDQILDSKISRKRLFYLVKWKGYDPSENSWQPAADLENSPILVNEFHTRYPQKPRPKSS